MNQLFSILLYVVFVCSTYALELVSYSTEGSPSGENFLRLNLKSGSYDLYCGKNKELSAVYKVSGVEYDYLLEYTSGSKTSKAYQIFRIDKNGSLPLMDLPMEYGYRFRENQQGVCFDYEFKDASGDSKPNSRIRNCYDPQRDYYRTVTDMFIKSPGYVGKKQWLHFLLKRKNYDVLVPELENTLYLMRKGLYFLPDKEQREEFASLLLLKADILLDLGYLEPMKSVLELISIHFSHTTAASLANMDLEWIKKNGLFKFRKIKHP
jgi:hypothetical protein